MLNTNALCSEHLDALVHSTAGLTHDDLVDLVRAAVRGCHGDPTPAALLQEVSHIRSQKVIF